MKRRFLTLAVLAGLSFASCSDDHLDTHVSYYFSEEDMTDLANSNPESALILSLGSEGGNNFFLNDFNTSGNGNYHDDFGHMAVNYGTDLMSNDNTMTQSNWGIQYYNYTARVETSLRTDMVWKFYYKVIYNMNQGLGFAPANATSTDILHVRGRMLAMRAFAYQYLVQLYANGEEGVPLLTNESMNFSRAATSDVKARIEADLLEAHQLLTGYSRTAKTLIDKNVVSGLLARFYLTEGNYAAAAQYAAEARQGYAPMATVNDGFNKITNTEWMWGADINSTTTTYYASFFSQIGNLNPGYAGLLESYKCVDKRIYDAIPATDKRKQWFTAATNPYGLPQYANVKFVDDTQFEGDYVFMRAAEMYLIEAEAKAKLGDNAGAQQALLALVSVRDAAYTGTTLTGDLLVEEILKHRKIELWGEGFAFYDMKRLQKPLERDYPGTNHIVNGMFNYPANSTKFTFQIPIAELNANAEITTQNPL